MHIRQAEKADLTDLQALASSSFIATYAAHNPAHVIEPYVKAAFSREQILAELGHSQNSFWVAVKSRQIVGYLKLREGDLPTCIKGKNSLEVERIYADPNCKRQGIGSALMAKAQAQARMRGFDSIWLGVWQKNLDSVAFYEAQGFDVAGKKTFMMDADLQVDHVMIKCV
jgi:ribosomal protein S18 acetylase RimI-like enzyme